MNKNYMADVAKFLGVELNEEYFKVAGNEHPYRLTDKGLRNFDNGRIENDMLVRLLTGDAVIVKKPWEPKDGEKYFFISIQNDKFSIGELTWNGDSYDYELYHMGNFFKTKKEALKNTSAYKEFIKSGTPHKNWRVE